MLEEWQFEATEEDREYACQVWPEIYPGVHGEVICKIRGDMKITFIDVIWAKVEGSGQVGKYLDTLEGIVIVNSVVSPRFRGMLERRGYKPYALGSGMQKGLEIDK